MSRRLRAEEEAPSRPVDVGAHDPSRHGGAYEDGKRTGPEPEYGFVVNKAGERVPADRHGKPADGSPPLEE